MEKLDNPRNSAEAFDQGNRIALVILEKIFEDYSSAALGIVTILSIQKHITAVLTRMAIDYPQIQELIGELSFLADKVMAEKELDINIKLAIKQKLD